MEDQPNIHPTAPDSLEKVAAEMATYIKRHAKNMEDGKFRVFPEQVVLGKALVKRYGDLALKAAQENAQD